MALTVPGLLHYGEMKQLLTIGYEGAPLDDLLRTLQEANVDILLDIREIPYSKRKEFCQKALNEALGKVNIVYRHEQRLGSPKKIRDKIRLDADHQAFRDAFNQHLKKQDSLLVELSELLSGNVALLCYERNYRQCHRNLVAAALTEITGLIPQHLVVKPANKQHDLF